MWDKDWRIISKIFSECFTSTILKIHIKTYIFIAQLYCMSKYCCSGFGQFMASPTDLIKTQIQMEGRRRLLGYEARVEGAADALRFGDWFGLVIGEHFLISGKLWHKVVYWGCGGAAGQMFRCKLLCCFLFLLFFLFIFCCCFWKLLFYSCKLTFHVVIAESCPGESWWPLNIWQVI